MDSKKKDKGEKGYSGIRLLSASELCDACAAELDHLSANDQRYSRKLCGDVCTRFWTPVEDFGKTHRKRHGEDRYWRLAAARKSQHRELYVILADHLSALQASEAMEALCQEFSLPCCVES